MAGVDLLLTSEWPAGVMATLKEAWPEEAEQRKLAKGAARHCSSPAVAELAVAAEPKYHAAPWASHSAWRGKLHHKSHDREQLLLIVNPCFIAIIL